VWLTCVFVSGVVLLAIFSLMAFAMKLMETIAAMPLLW
jgi:hypothetical protein